MKEGELFMPFAPNTRSRSWMVTIQVANMENARLTKEEYENAELLANFMIETWEHSGKDRTAGISVCRSKEALPYGVLWKYNDIKKGIRYTL